MQRLRLLIGDQLTASLVRYGISGLVVAAVYLSIPLVLNTIAAVPVEVSIPVAYVAAATVHFNLQRRFVFRHVARFALSTRQQIGRYLGMAAVQYPVTAVLTAVLPPVLGISQRVAFVGVALAWSLCVFVLLRTRIFHPSSHADDLEHGTAAQTPEISPAELDPLKQELLR